jgi:NADH:ubiquinone oxidoreductase subunit 2 (subunit N)
LLLAVFAVMMSLIGAFYYLRVVKVMYFDATHYCDRRVGVPSMFALCCRSIVFEGHGSQDAKLAGLSI